MIKISFSTTLLKISSVSFHLNNTISLNAGQIKKVVLTNIEELFRIFKISSTFTSIYLARAYYLKTAVDESKQLPLKV